MREKITFVSLQLASSIMQANSCIILDLCFLKKYVYFKKEINNCKYFWWCKLVKF